MPAPQLGDVKKFFEWDTRAYDAGCVGAAHDLIAIHSNRNSIHYNPEMAAEMAARLQEAIDAEEPSN